MLDCLFTIPTSYQNSQFRIWVQGPVKMSDIRNGFYCVVQTLLLKTEHSNFLPPIHLPFINNHSIVLLRVMYAVHTADNDDFVLIMKIKNNNNRFSNNNMTIVAWKIISVK
jgi:hypothetical protein